MRGLSSCQNPLIHPHPVPSRQRINENVYILNAPKQVTRCRNLVLLDASTKSRCLEKLLHSSMLSRQLKTVILSPKLVEL